ncbi:MAG TPA: cupin domain-containing protein [Burkholderiales bacterium]|jgi:uncharacterized cupin superfamily protein|nr:cupin domain-containing protein [Burkholderiales bacterium]
MPETRPITALEVRPQSGNPYPEPFASRMGNADWRALGDAFGLTQFGFNLETLEPGAQSSLRHWHTLADEFVYVLEGELVVRLNDGEFPLRPGMCIGFKAGEPNAHHLVNRSNMRARFLIAGSRAPGDHGFYPDDDVAWLRTEKGHLMVHKDGSPYPTKD